MGKEDKTEKMFVGCADVFAELINVLVYKGEKVLQEADLLPGPTESVYPKAVGQRKQVLQQQFRDFSMYEMIDGKAHALYNVENQSRIDRQMALRCAGYDGIEYRRQHKRGKRKQGIYPVISLVLNWGIKPWKSPTSVKDLLDYPVHKEAEEYINNNKMHVFDMRFLSKEVYDKFYGDMRVVLDYLMYPDSIRKNMQVLKNPEEVLRMIATLSGDIRYLDKIVWVKQGGKNKMCEVLDRAINEGRNEGRCEGRCEGLISVCKDFKLSYEQTAAKLKEKFQLSDQEIEKNMKQYW